MKIRPAVKRRIIWAIALTVIVVVILIFADAYSLTEDTKRCTPRFWAPSYIGCALAAHEGLAGGLIGAAGALWAAGLAFQAIRDQLAQERDQEDTRREQEIAALKAAVYVDIADRAARCVHDYIDPWRDFRIEDAGSLTAERVDMFRPATAVVYPAIAGQVGLLEPAILVPVTQFYFRLDALSHAIESLVAICRQPKTSTRNKARKLRVADIKTRLESCFEPALSALDGLAVPEAAAIEQAIGLVYRYLRVPLRDALRDNIRAIKARDDSKG